MSFAEPDDDDEQWLPEPKFDSPADKWFAPRGMRRPQPPPIFVGSRTRTCGCCQQRAATELYRDGKCLACQVAEFLGPL